MQRILFIPFEFVSWQLGGTWTYDTLYGWEEGLRARPDIELTVIPGSFELPSTLSASWLFHAERLLAGKTFDQIWILYPHIKIEAETRRFLAGLAPIRLGILMESLSYSEAEIATAPNVSVYRNVMREQTDFLTHCAVCDEADTEFFRSFGLVSVWSPWSIPERFLSFPPPAKRETSAVFYGALYGKRAEMVKHPLLQGLLEVPPRPESSTEFPQLYDETATYFYARLHSGWLAELSDLEEYMALMRRIRLNVFQAWLADARRFSAMICLPTRFKGYSNRIVEAAAIGLPAISWRVPERPRNSALFQENAEILLFDGENSAELADRIRAVSENPDRSRTMVRNLRATVRSRHTSEIRIGQLLEWIASGFYPNFL